MKNSDWPLGWQNGIRPFIEITLKRQLSKSTLFLADSNSSVKKCRVVSLRSWRFKVTTGRKTRATLLFHITVEHFRWRVASLTSSPVRLIGTSRYGFTCFDHWFSSRDQILDDSGMGRVRCDMKKKYDHPIWFLDLSKILSWSLFAVRLSHFVVMMRVVSLTLWSYKQRLLCNYYSILDTDDVIGGTIT